MARDSRMSRMLHLLIHMDRHMEKATSETISKMLGTHPVVARRMMSGLRDKGFLASEKGHNGGWSLKAELASITLLDIYEAVGEPTLFSIGAHSEHPQCLVEQSVDARVAETLNEAETLIRKRFAEITVADLGKDFETKQSQHSSNQQCIGDGKGSPSDCLHN